MAYLFIFVNKDRVHYRAGISASETVHVYTRVRTCLPPMLIVVQADEILTCQTENKSCQPRNCVTDTQLSHSNDCWKKKKKREMLKIVCLACKFMRLHVAISFEKRLYPSYRPKNINEFLCELILFEERRVWWCNDEDELWVCWYFWHWLFNSANFS